MYMGIDCDAYGGYGIELEDDFIEKLGCTDEISYELKSYLINNNYKNLDVINYGSYYYGEISYAVVILDPINKYSEGVAELRKLGLEGEISFICEVLES